MNNNSDGIKKYDRIIIGAGLYGLYAALKCGQRGEHVLVLEYDSCAFERATYINQARVHMGYHYPRSLSTAMKSAGYYRRFHEDFSFAIHDKFTQIYATSARFSWTDASEFIAFCRAAEIRCDEVSVNQYFQPGMCDGAFLTEEDTYDAHILRDYFHDKISELSNVVMLYNVRIQVIFRRSDLYEISYHIEDGAESFQEQSAETEFVLNATYASTNQILQRVTGQDGKKQMQGFEPFKIKYELCEIILCDVSDKLRDTGITVMDGPFFSIMPFGQTGLHSLTAVTFTPHVTSYDVAPSFSCQEGVVCSPEQLSNCNNCPHKPHSAWSYMSHLADKYLKPDYSYQYKSSLFSMKPILKSSEVDDSRPTAIRVNSQNPTFISVLSGKINTVYDLDEFLK